jgi:hypothetical protein
MQDMADGKDPGDRVGIIGVGFFVVVLHRGTLA